MQGVTIAYSGVHQAYQLALAAAENDCLDEFLCSLFVAPGKWGQRVAFLLGDEALLNRTCARLPAKQVREHPWPLLLHRVKLNLFGSHAEPWTAANPMFDRWAAKQLTQSHSKVFVGSETCCRDCFRVARERGIMRILDVPQVHSAFLVNVLQRGHEEVGLPFAGKIDNAEIATRKEEELELADRLLVYSEVHRRSFLESGIPSERLVEIPLWADANLWDRPREYKATQGRPLQVLFVGIVGVRKGVPWLLEAARLLGKAVRVRLIGVIEDGFEEVLRRYPGTCEHVAPLSKAALAEEYRKADVFILPSLVDSFGFVAMEAMLSGLPTIASTNCGVPLPDDSWRVPIMNPAAIAERLQYYIEEPSALESHGNIARQFARGFTPELYRSRIGTFLQSLLCDEAAG